MDNISYKGIVTLYTQNHSPIVVHNQGEIGLFKLITDMLAGAFSNKLLPSYIKAEGKAGETVTITVFNNFPITSVSIPNVANNASTLEIQCAVSSYGVHIENVTSANVTLYLCDGNGTTLASTTLATSTLESLSASSPQVFIKWELIFQNVQVTE